MNKIIILVIIPLLIGCKNHKPNSTKPNLDIYIPDSTKLNLDVSTAEFVLSDCEITYKGKPIPIGQPIEEWVKVFGKYDRTDHQIEFTWDSIGIGIRNGYITYGMKNIPDSLRKHDKFLIFFSNLKSPMGKKGQLEFANGEYEFDEEKIIAYYSDNPKLNPPTKQQIEKWREESNYKNFIYPLQTYDKVISLDGVPIQKGFSLEDINYYREKGDNLSPFMKKNAESHRDYNVGDQGYYYNYKSIWGWYRDTLPDPENCRYFIQVFYSNYELEFIQITKFIN